MGRMMKDSGIEWVGQIPSEWSLTRMKSCIASRDGGAWGDEPTGEDGDEICLRIADFNYPKFTFKNCDTSELTKRHYRKEVIGRLRLEKDDILIEKSGGGEKTPVGRTVLFDKNYAALYANFMDRLRCSEIVLPKFMQYIFVTFYKNEYTRNYIKQTTGIQNLDLTSMLSKELIPLCEIGEQEKIVAVLDHKCAEIDAVLEKTRASIEEYKKLKQAVITQTVTHGIRQGRSFKDTGIEWIGSIPTEWNNTKLKYFASLRAGITLGKAYPKDAELVEVPYLRVANVQGSYVDLSNVTTLLVLPEEVEKYRLHAGEVLMTEGGDRDKLGRGCVWKGELDPCLHQNHVFAVTTNEEKLLGQFLAYMTVSSVARTYFDITAKKTTNLACTNSTTILNFTMPIPPIDEQREIVAYLDQKCSEMNVLISKKEQFLAELESYKKSLIYEYVTGKKEVPHT